MKKVILLVGLSLAMTTQATASDKTFMEGKKLFQENCLTCHNAELEPAQAPPMFGVQMKYKMATKDKAAFVDKVTAFVTNPTEDKAILKEPVKVLGVMPNMGFEEDDVRKIAAYIHDETFEPPCNHWKHAAERFKQEGKMKLYQKHQKKYDMMCTTSSTKPHQPMHKIDKSVTAEAGSLKAIMQQLGIDFLALESAILVEDFAMAEKAAHAIAYHDTPSLGTKMKLLASLRTDMSKFKAADDRVHKLALEIKEAAKTQDMTALIAKQSQMLGACMSCHVLFRSKIAAILHGES